MDLSIPASSNSSAIRPTATPGQELSRGILSPRYHLGFKLHTPRPLKRNQDERNALSDSAPITCNTCGAAYPKQSQASLRPRRASLKRYENATVEQAEVGQARAKSLEVYTNGGQSLCNAELGFHRARSSLVALCVENPRKVLIFRTLRPETSPGERLVILGEYLHTNSQTRQERKYHSPRYLENQAIDSAHHNGKVQDRTGEVFIFFGSSHALRSILREKEARRLREEAQFFLQSHPRRSRRRSRGGFSPEPIKAGRRRTGSGIFPVFLGQNVDAAECKEVSAGMAVQGACRAITSNLIKPILSMLQPLHRERDGH